MIHGQPCSDSIHLPPGSSHRHPEDCFLLPSNCGPALGQAAQQTSLPSHGLPPRLLQGSVSLLFVFGDDSPSALGNLYEQSIILPDFQKRDQGPKEERVLPEVTQPVSREAQIQGKSPTFLAPPVIKGRLLASNGEDKYLSKCFLLLSRNTKLESVP